jgi:hypothetical protein
MAFVEAYIDARPFYFLFAALNRFTRRQINQVEVASDRKLNSFQTAVTDRIDMHIQVALDTHIADRVAEQAGHTFGVQRRSLLQLAVKLDLACWDVSLETDILSF